MGKVMAASARTVVAVSDASRRARERLASDGELCELDQEALLLLDFASAWAERADLARRKRQMIEDTGDESDWLTRLEREHRRDVEQRLKRAA